MSEMKEKKGLNLLTELVSLWPALPYLSFGVWLAWSHLTYSGTLWLSDNEMNGVNLSFLYIISTAAFAIVCLVAPLATQKTRQALSNKRFVVGAGLLTSLGCLFVILAGPYYLEPYMNTGFFFWGGAVMSGIGTGIIGLKCGELYGALPPRKVLLYASLSQLVVAFIYFVVIGSPFWAPIAGGPSLVGILSFTLLPIASALLTMVPRQGISVDADRRVYSENPRNLPAAFWRLIILSFLLPVVASMTRAVVVNEHTLTVTLEGNGILMLLRILMAVLFVVVAVRPTANRINFGKLYSLIAIFMVAAIACIPVFGILNPEWSVLIYFASSVFEFVTWCLLAFVVFQKRISPVIVFGFGRGVFMLGSALGWLFGVYALPQIAAGPLGLAFFLLCAGTVLFLSFVLFSERDFERLFSPIDESELSLETLFDIDIREQKGDKKGRFLQVIEKLTDENQLSVRESEVFRYLAMGHGSDFVAEKLQVSWNTVRTHTHNVYVKLGVHSRQELINRVDTEMNSKE